jgi:hypothetical protein
VRAWHRLWTAARDPKNASINDLLLIFEGDRYIVKDACYTQRRLYRGASPAFAILNLLRSLRNHVEHLSQLQYYQQNDNDSEASFADAVTSAEQQYILSKYLS